MCVHSHIKAHMCKAHMWRSEDYSYESVLLSWLTLGRKLRLVSQVAGTSAHWALWQAQGISISKREGFQYSGLCFFFFFLNSLPWYRQVKPLKIMMSLQGSSSKKHPWNPASLPRGRERLWYQCWNAISPCARRNNYETLAARENLNVRFRFLCQMIKVKWHFLYKSWD